MEVSSVHSNIELAIKNKLNYIHAEYVGICKASRQKPEPYDVTYFDHLFFFHILMRFNIAKEFHLVVVMVMPKIRGIKYSPNNC